MRKKQTASLSLDLDNLWAYLKTHGDSQWERYPTYLPQFVPIILDWLEKHQLTITFFVVGRDAAREENQDALRLLALAGHEIGNHSFNHEPWMQSYERERIVEDLSQAEEAIEAVVGYKPAGFRGPGFCTSSALLQSLQKLGYGYDASILPSCLGPLARLYYMWDASMNAEERKTRRVLFGRWRDGFYPLKPFEWRCRDGGLLEIPVTTIPMMRLPFHLSYLIWLSRFSRPLAAAYMQMGLQLCRWRGVEPSYLLHPLDFLGKEDVDQLPFFPGMDLPRAHKLEIAGQLIHALQANFDVVTMSEHARRIRSNKVRPRALPDQ